MKITELSVAMVCPKFSLNVGYVARVMNNFGLQKMILVNRRKLGMASVIYASEGRTIVNNAKNMSWQHLLQEFDFVIGTTAITSKGRNPVRDTLNPEVLARLSFEPSKSVLVLGRDTTGLTNEELKMCDVVVTIPTGTRFTTMNISHALAVILYVLFREGTKGRRGITRELRTSYMSYIDNILTKSGFKDPKSQAIKTIFRKMLNQSSLNDNQVATMLGLLRKVQARMN